MISRVQHPLFFVDEAHVTCRVAGCRDDPQRSAARSQQFAVGQFAVGGDPTLPGPRLDRIAVADHAYGTGKVITGQFILGRLR